MKKAIYVITNKINGKQYIGQTIHPEKRWWEHRRRAITKYDAYPIHLAIKKYGEENFEFRVVEWTDDYDNREHELILEYNTLVPNGYNLIVGGHSPIMYEEDHPRNKVTNQMLESIVEDLRKYTMTDVELSKKYCVSEKIISDINHGRSHRLPNITYPIRTFNQRPNRLSEKQADEIKSLLLNSKLSYQEIADKIGTSKSIVYQINTGRNFRRVKNVYPIRRNEFCALRG